MLNQRLLRETRARDSQFGFRLRRGAAGAFTLILQTSGRSRVRTRTPVPACQNKVPDYWGPCE
eukprot:7971556-Pyramimonas_sp.AAC.1